MGSYQEIIQGKELAKMKSVAIAAVTSYPAMQIQYCGPYAYAKVAVADSGDMTLSGDDTDGTTSLHAIDLSTPGITVDTFGELKDVINGYGDFRCKLLGVLASESTDNMFQTLSAAHLKTGATAAIMANGLTLYMDQATLLDTGFCITNHKFTSQPSGSGETSLNGMVTDELCINSLHYLYFDVATQVNNGSIKVYSCDDTNGVNTETLLWTNAYTAGTAEEHGTTSPVTPDSVFLRGIMGHRLCIKFDAVDTAQSSTLDCRAIGYTRHMTGGQVEGGNYTGCT